MAFQGTRLTPICHYKKYIVFAVIGFSMLFQNKVLAQVEAVTKSEIFIAKNSVHAEFAGNSGGYALNYGRIIFQKIR